MHRLRQREGAFTTVEMLVIVIIIGILAAIAITTYLLQRDKAERSSGLSTIRNTETFVESIRAGTNTLATTVAEFEAETDAYDYVNSPAASADDRIVSLWSDGSGERVSFAVYGGDFCFYLLVDDTAGSFRHRAPIDTVDCNAGEFTSGPGTSWSG